MPSIDRVACAEVTWGDVLIPVDQNDVEVVDADKAVVVQVANKTSTEDHFQSINVFCVHVEERGNIVRRIPLSPAVDQPLYKALRNLLAEVAFVRLFRAGSGALVV